MDQDKTNKRSTSWKFRELILDGRDFTLKKGHQEIRLGKKNLAILKTLMEHPEQIFTKEQLYENVWHEIYLTGDNTLNTHLSNLRKKDCATRRESRVYRNDLGTRGSTKRSFRMIYYTVLSLLCLLVGSLYVRQVLGIKKICTRNTRKTEESFQCCINNKNV